MLASQLLFAVALAARDAPGRSDDPGLTGDVIIIVVIAALFVLGVAGWFAWQRRA